MEHFFGMPTSSRRSWAWYFSETESTNVRTDPCPRGPVRSNVRPSGSGVPEITATGAHRMLGQDPLRRRLGRAGSGVLRLRAGTERCARTVATASVAAASAMKSQPGTSGVLAEGKHARRLAALARQRTGIDRGQFRMVGDGCCPPQRSRCAFCVRSSARSW